MGQQPEHVLVNGFVIHGFVLALSSYFAWPSPFFLARLGRVVHVCEQFVRHAVPLSCYS